MHSAHEVGAPAEWQGPRRPAHPPPHVLPKPGGPIGTPRLLLIKPGQACGKGVDGCGRQAQARRAEVRAQPVKAFSSGLTFLRFFRSMEESVLKGEEMRERIIIDANVHHGKPVIRGTRVPVVRLIGGLAGGMTIEKVADEYGVTEDDVRAALTYASELIEQEEHHPLPTP